MSKIKPFMIMVTGLALSIARAQDFSTVFSLQNNDGIVSRTYTAAAFGDFNNDGFLDLAVSHHEDATLYVFKNNPANPGTFSQYYTLPGSPERQVAWGDFDNDGDLDLFANEGAAGAKAWLIENSGAPDFNLAVVDGPNTVLAYVNNPQGAGWFDANGDGRLDLFHSSGSEMSTIYLNQYVSGQSSETWFSQIKQDIWETGYYNASNTLINGNQGNVNGSYSVTLDIDNDGRQDILYAVDQSGGSNRLFFWKNFTTRGSYSLSFREMGRLVLDEWDAPSDEDFNWSGVVAWDADNDGDLEILYVNHNGYQGGDPVRDQFFVNQFGYGGLSWSESNYQDKLEANQTVAFSSEATYSGGVAFGDLNNDGWQDVYVVHKSGYNDNLYMHRGISAFNSGTYTASANSHTKAGNAKANGVTFGDVDNDGDLDMFLCNQGRIYLNQTNTTNAPASLNAPSGAGAEHYLGVMVSGASLDKSVKTKDGIGSRVYLYRHVDYDSTSYGEAQLVGMRDIDGGSGYGSQATQIQHFGLSTSLGAEPHKLRYSAKVIFPNGDIVWRHDVVPDSVRVTIVWDGGAKTTVLEQVIEITNANIDAQIWFSTTNQMADTTTGFTEGATPIYVLVKDQAMHPDSTYQITITTASAETGTFDLAVAGDLFVAEIPVSYAAILAGDDTVQALLAGDNFVARYRDALYGDTVQASAGYAAKSVAKPESDVPDGYYFNSDTTVTLTTATPGAYIRYTTDGTQPTQTNGTLNAPIKITSSTVLKAVAYLRHSATNYVLSEVLIVNFNARSQTGAPRADPPTTYFTDSIQVTLVPDSALDEIYYTSNGSNPDTANAVNTTKYTGPIWLTGSLDTLKFYAVRGTWVPSIIVTEVYTKRDTVAMPVANPAGGDFVSIVHPELTSRTFGASIYYTTDGSDPATSPTRKTYGAIIPITVNTTLKAVAEKPQWVTSAVMTETYTKNAASSTLKILDANGQEVSYLSEINTTFTVLITSAEPALTQAQPLSITRVNIDSNTLTLPAFNRVGELYTFKAAIPLSIKPGQAQQNNAKVESAWYDTLEVTWVNPNDSSDIAADTMIIRPFPKQAAVIFSRNLSAASPVTQYQQEADTIFVIVQDQVMPPGLNGWATLITSPLFGDRQPDTLAAALEEISPGVYGAPVPADRSATALSGDLKLQVLKGDVISASYTDAMDGDSAKAAVEYGSPGEVTGVVAFTDAQYRPLAGNVNWRPDAGHLYLTYIDDYITQPKTLTLTVVNTTGTGSRSYDTLSVTLTSPVRQDSIGAWHARVPMKEAEQVSDPNTLEVFFWGVVTATVVSHSKEGFALGPVKDTLQVAYDDVQAEITIKDNGTGGDVTRPTGRVLISIREQNFTSTIDTLLADVECVQTSDKISNVKIIQNVTGTFTTQVTKEEKNADKTDANLQCAEEDEIQVTYIDPITGDPANGTANWVDFRHTRVHIESEKTGQVITVLNEIDENSFIAVVNALSDRMDATDTLEVALTVAQGETMTVKAVETGPFTGEFRSFPVTFEFSPTPSSTNTVLEGKLNMNSPDNKATVTASVITKKDTGSTNFDAVAAFIPVAQTWIVDGNVDGRADTIYSRFEKNLPSLPNSINSIDWPEEGANGYTALKSLEEISYGSKPDGSTDSALVVVMGSGLEFGFGKTAASPHKPPGLTLPEGPLFRGVQSAIQDRVSPIITKAVKIPSDLNYYEDKDGNSRKNPDTLVITLSEKITPIHKQGVPWDSLFQFMLHGGSKDNTHPLIFLETATPQISDNGLTWTVIVTNAPEIFKPQVDDSIFMNPDAPYQDEAPAKNKPGDRLEVITGLDPNGGINNSFIFIPVEGIDPANPEILIANGVISGKSSGQLVPENARVFDKLDGTVDYHYEWVRPVGLNGDDGTVQPNPVCESGVENAYPTLYPNNCLSSVKVFSQDKYTAKISIFDNVGKFIHGSIQRFGDCGETDNLNRQRPEGLISWLVWNQKDNNGRFVGSGVYIWKVRFISSGGEQYHYYRQGVARAIEPEEGCAAP